MNFRMNRRSALKAGAALAASYALPVGAQAKTLRFAAVFSDRDIRAALQAGRIRIDPYDAACLTGCGGTPGSNRSPSGKVGVTPRRSCGLRRVVFAPSSFQ